MVYVWYMYGSVKKMQRNSGDSRSSQVNNNSVLFLLPFFPPFFNIHFGIARLSVFPGSASFVSYCIYRGTSVQCLSCQAWSACIGYYGPVLGLIYRFAWPLILPLPTLPTCT
ncbi:hypothetical protein F4820DRAFT_424466 [Hypoxylon rubiginosum]|uniref:Uncharacterized protein n=1 Tax=Hypoxylon rubiginosum TaxID=110542 RepID=A0ACB9YXU6_9PEZI|nr:hypothetical protein F4820DRAFT_424466 [Hypoxylon rubiginosum]